MSPLPHFSNIQSHYGKYEPIHKNLYEVTIILPTLLQSIHPTASVLLLENTVTCKLPTYPDLGTAMQRFKYSTRMFVLTPEKTSLDDVDIQLNLNQDNNYQVYCWRIMKDWYDLAWNNADGSLHYKRNLVGDIIINVHDKEGHVIRRVTYHNAQVKGLSGWNDLSWDENTAIENLTAKFVVDYWEDLYY